MADGELFASRYRVVRLIGSGGMGDVRLVEDTLRGAKLMALKTMKQFGDEAAAEGFRAEFRNVHGVIHPNIPEVFDFGVLPPPIRQLYFTCEFVDGAPLDRLADTWTPHQLHLILVRLCRALSFLHSRGLLHRDLKPQNILGRLDDSGGFALLKVVDFGLASLHGKQADTCGTIDYMAPEILDGGDATIQTDIYAVGMLLYRLAVGRMPFAGDDPLAVARQRCSSEAPPALRFRPDLPVGLSDVIAALIHLRPEDRPASARRVLALLNEREGTDFPYETPETRTAYIRSAAPASNADAQEVLRHERQYLLDGETPPPVVLLAEPGLGRARLIRDFASELTLDGLPVCLARNDENLKRAAAARVLLVPLASKLSEDLLCAAIETAIRDHRWCILGVSELTHALKEAVGKCTTLTLLPLSLEGTRAFVEATFPDSSFPDYFAERLHRTTLGFATALQTTLDLLLESEHLRIGLAGWELLPGLWDFPLHPDVARHIERTLASLSPDPRYLTQVLACSSSPLPLALLQQLAAFATGALHAALADLDAIGWITRSPEGVALRFIAVTDYLAENADEQLLGAIHSDLKSLWTSEATAQDSLSRREVLFHDFYAGTWAVPAREAAESLRLALDDGEIRWVRRLIESCLLSQPPDDIWTVMLDALVSVEYIEGNIEASSEHLGRILRHGEAEASTENLEALARYAMFEEKLGRTERAEAILERCLPVLPQGNDSRAGIIFGTLAWIAFKRGDADKARRLAEEGLVRLPPQAADAGQALLLNTVATLAFYRGDADAAALFWKRCLEVNEKIRDRKGIANMYNNLGVLAAQSGDRLNARGLWQKCAELSREINDVHRLAGIYNNLGIDALETGQLPEAEEYYLKSLGLFRRLKNPREQVEILSNLGELAYYRADFSRALAYLQEAVSLASTLEDHECEVEPLVHLGKLLLTLEHLDMAESTLKRACQTAHDVGARKSEGQALETLAALHARKGETGETLESLQQAHRLLSEDMDPLAQLHLHLTECAIAAESNDRSAVANSLSQARKIADIKWDPFTSARTLVYGLLFAQEDLDTKEKSRVFRQLSVYPDLLWRLHWATGRRLTSEGALRNALDEYGRGVAVLKAIASRLSEDSRNNYLNTPHIRRFKEEAVALRNSMKS